MLDVLIKIPKKITLILDKLNHKYLNELSNNFDAESDEKFAYGKFVNRCIDFQRMMSAEIKFNTAEAYKEQIIQLTEIRNRESYDKQNYYNQLISQYKELYAILCEDNDLDLSLPIRAWKKTKNGHAVIPKDWVQLKAFGSLDEHENILVVECRDGHKHGNVPHFYLASDCEYGCRITEQLEEEIYAEIARVYEPFAELRRRDIESNKIPEFPVSLENLEAWDREPHFGIFVVPEAGNIGFYNYTTGKFKYPAGAYVEKDKQ